MPIQSPGSNESLKPSKESSICLTSLFEPLPFKLIFSKISASYGLEREYV